MMRFGRIKHPPTATLDLRVGRAAGKRRRATAGVYVDAMSHWERPPEPVAEPRTSSIRTPVAIAAIVIVIGGLVFLAWYAGS